MKCIQVLPILKHTFSEELTYWTTFDFNVGDLIQVELNHRKIYAIVSSIVPLSEAKEFIKSREFSIKKITEYIKVDFFSSAFIKAVLLVSKYYIRPFGEVLSEYIPKKVLEELDKRNIHTKAEKNSEENQRSSSTTIYIQKPFAERISYIQHLQDEQKKICIVVPTDQYKKHIQNNLEDSENITIITPIDIYKLDENNFDICILQYAGSEYYRHMRKNFDSRLMIRTYCKLKHIQLIEMDDVLPVYSDLDPKHIETIPMHKMPEVHIVDQKVSKVAKVAKTKSKKMNRPEDDVDIRYFMEHDMDIITHKKLRLISPELYSLLAYAEKKEEDVFIYTTRKGLSTSVKCSDCGHVLSCPTCKKPYTIKSKKGTLTYECIEGHAPISIDSLCPVCGGMHLQGLGAGTDALVEELKHVIHMPIVTVDSDVATQAGARNIFKKRKEKKHKPTIYIGTELALHQGLDEKFTYSAIASLETLLNIPSPIAELEAARVIETVRERTTHALIIQTRTPNHTVWQSLTSKSWMPLITTVQNDVKELGLPPYRTHIQLSTQKKDTEPIYTYMQSYPDLEIHKVENEIRDTIHIYVAAWPNALTHTALYRYLKSLPKHIRIEVDSPSLM